MGMFKFCTWLAVISAYVSLLSSPALCDSYAEWESPSSNSAYRTDPNICSRRTDNFIFRFGYNAAEGIIDEQLAQGQLQLLQHMHNYWMEIGLHELGGTDPNTKFKGIIQPHGCFPDDPAGGGAVSFGEWMPGGYWVPGINVPSNSLGYDANNGCTPHEFGHGWQNQGGVAFGNPSEGLANWMMRVYLECYPGQGHAMGVTYGHAVMNYGAMGIFEYFFNAPGYGAEFINKLVYEPQIPGDGNDDIIRKAIRCDTSGAVDPAGAIRDGLGMMNAKLLDADFPNHRWDRGLAYDNDTSYWMYHSHRVKMVRQPGAPGWYRQEWMCTPQQGSNSYIPLTVTATGSPRVVTCDFRPVSDAVRGSYFRACFVAFNQNKQPRYSRLWGAGENSFALADDENAVYLAVYASPREMLHDPYYNDYTSENVGMFPYRIKLTGATPRDWRWPAPECGTYLNHANGGGMVANTAFVDSSAYVGPNAMVLGNARVYGGSRIEDYALVDGKAVIGRSGQADTPVISGHACVKDNAQVYGHARVTDYSWVFGNSKVYENALLVGHSKVNGGSIFGSAVLTQSPIGSMFGYQGSISGCAIIGGDTSIRDWTYGSYIEWVHGVNGNVADNNYQYMGFNFEKKSAIFAMDQFSLNHGYLMGEPLVVGDTVNSVTTRVLSLNGSSQYVELKPEAVNFPNVSIAAWVNWTGSDDDQMIWSMGDGNAKFMYFTPKSAATGKLKFSISNGSTTQYIDGASSFASNTWTHVAVTLDGNTGTIYVNGVQTGQNTSLTIDPDQLNASLMENANYLGRGNAGGYFQGRVDEFKIYNKALTTSEIALASTEVVAGTMPVADSAPPTPNAATWLVAPTLLGDSAIVMTATEGTDAGGNGVLYYFACLNDSTHDSGWISEPRFTDGKCVPGTTYSYTVTMKDRRGNSGAASSQASASLPSADTTPPTPNSPTFAVAPKGDSATSITMTATRGIDNDETVMYKFTRIPHSATSGWTSSPTWTDTGLTSGNNYTYTLQMKDGHDNMTGISTSDPAVVRDDTAPAMDATRMQQWLTEPYALLDKSMRMTTRRQPEWDVQYYIECVENPSINSGWIDNVGSDIDTSWHTPVMADGTWSFRYKIRDKSPQLNESVWSIPAKGSVLTTNSYHDYSLSQLASLPESTLVRFTGVVTQVNVDHYIVSSGDGQTSIKVTPHNWDCRTDLAHMNKTVEVRGHLWSFNGGPREVTYAYLLQTSLTGKVEMDDAYYNYATAILRMDKASYRQCLALSPDSNIEFRNVASADQLTLSYTGYGALGLYVNGVFQRRIDCPVINNENFTLVTVTGISIPSGATVAFRKVSGYDSPLPDYVIFGGSYVVSGVVTDADAGNAPVSGALVGFSTTPGSLSAPTFTALTDASGNYNVRLPSGNWYGTAAVFLDVKTKQSAEQCFSLGSDRTGLNFSISWLPSRTGRFEAESSLITNARAVRRDNTSGKYAVDGGTGAAIEFHNVAASNYLKLSHMWLSGQISVYINGVYATDVIYDASVGDPQYGVFFLNSIPINIPDHATVKIQADPGEVLYPIDYIEVGMLPSNTITTSTGLGGSISPSGTTQVPNGMNITYTITPNLGFEPNVVVDGVSLGFISSYTFANVTADHTISVTFSPGNRTRREAELASPFGGAGAYADAAASGGACVAYLDSVGSGVEFVNVPASTSMTVHYCSPSSGSYSFYVNGVHARDIVFTGNGTWGGHFVDVTVLVSIPAGATVRVRCDAGDTGWNIDYVDFISSTTYHMISASAGAGGAISPSGAISVGNGANQTFDISSNSGYYILDVVVDGSSVGAVSTYTFSNVTANHTISASFSPITYTITASAGVGGTISPSGAVSVDCGANQTIDIFANSGYYILDVLVDGSSVGAVSSLTLTNVTADHTVVATFANDLVAYYKFNETGGLSASDSSGNNQTATLTESCVWTAGKYGNAVDIPGGTNYVACSNGITSGVTNFSVSAWVYLDTVSTNMRVFDFGRGRSYYMEMTPKHAESNGKYQFVIKAGTTTRKVTGPAAIPAGSWQFVTVTLSSQTLALYLNGVKVDQITNCAINPNSLGSTTANRIGDSQTSTHPHLDGRVDDFRFYNRALTEVEITALYNPSQVYTISATAGTNGSISPSGAVTVNPGASQMFTITPDVGYSVSQVTVDGVDQGAIPSSTFSNVTANHTISATFSPITYTITASAGVGGTISPSGAVSVDNGANQTFDIFANSGYYILDVLVDGSSVGAVSSLTLTNVTADHTVVATFANDLVAYYKFNETGGLSASDSSGNNQTATLTESCVWTAGKYGNAVDIPGGTSYVACSNGITSGVTNFSVSAWVYLDTVSTNMRVFDFGRGRSYYMEMTPKHAESNGKYQFVIKAGTTTRKVTGPAAIPAGSWQFVTVTLSSQTLALYLNGVKVDQITNCAINPNSLGSTTANRIGDSQTSTHPHLDGRVDDFRFYNRALTEDEITALYNPSQVYTISATAGTNGSIGPSGAVTVNTGASQMFTITPDVGYSVSQVTVDGVDQGAIPSFTFSNVTANHTISATFSPITYTITASVGAGGTISPSGAVSVDSGANQTIDIFANSGYYILDVLVDGFSVGAVSTYTFSNVTADHTISATFNPITYTITASAGAGGVIDPSGSVAADHGSSHTFTITPNSGYSVSQVTVDGVNQGAIPSYTFSNVTANHTITATFTTATPNMIWDAVQYITRYTDVSTEGVSVAGICPNSTTVNGVEFATNSTFISHNVPYAAPSGFGGSTGDPGYDNITKGGWYAFADICIITLSNLTIDRQYLVQIWVNDSRYIGNYRNELVDGGVTLNFNQGTTDSLGQYVIGRFTADSTIRNITLLGNESTQLNAVQLRWIPDPNQNFIRGTVTPGSATVYYSTTSGSGFTPVTTTGDGTYIIPVDDNTTYYLKAGKANYFTSEEVTIPVAASDVMGIDFALTAIPLYSITATAGPGGTISPSSVVTVMGGANQTFVVQPEPLYVVDQFMVDGNPLLPSTTSYTFDNVNEDGHTISVTFRDASVPVANLAALKAAANSGQTIRLTGIVTVSAVSAGMFFVAEEQYQDCVKVIGSDTIAPGDYITNLAGVVTSNNYRQYTITLLAPVIHAVTGSAIEPVSANVSSCITDPTLLTRLVRVSGNVDIDGLDYTINDGYATPLPVKAGGAIIPTGSATLTGVLWNEDDGSVVLWGAGEPAGYVYSSFTGDGEDGLHLLTSTDGKNWRMVRNYQSMFQQSSGLMRDPSICRDGNGKYHLVWTTGWWEDTIGISHSDNLVNWTPSKKLYVWADYTTVGQEQSDGTNWPADLSVPVTRNPKVRNCWAPDIFYDAQTKEYVIFWATTIDDPSVFPLTWDPNRWERMNQRIYYITTKDFVTYTPRKFFYAPPDRLVIDACMTKVAANSYRMIIKDEVTQSLHVCTSTQTLTSWEQMSSGFWSTMSAQAFTGIGIAPENAAAEGPTVVQVGSVWYIYCDYWNAARNGMFSTTDFSTITRLNDEFSALMWVRHGTAFRVPKTTITALEAQ